MKKYPQKRRYAILKFCYLRILEMMSSKHREERQVTSVHRIGGSWLKSGLFHVSKTSVTFLENRIIIVVFQYILRVQWRCKCTLIMGLIHRKYITDILIEVICLRLRKQNVRELKSPEVNLPAKDWAMGSVDMLIHQHSACSTEVLQNKPRLDKEH